MLAKDSSSGKRLAQVICAITWVLLSGGAVFGFAALKPVLVYSGVYEWECDYESNNIDNNDIGKFAEGGLATCTKQDLKLNLLFTVAAALTNICAFPVGRILDVYGPKVCGLLGAFFLYLACFTFIYAESLVSWGQWIDPYLFGYCFMALGGPFAFISSFQLSNAFPERSGTILALLTGAFDASSAVFLFYRWGYDYFEGFFSLKSFFSVYLVVPIFITVVQFTLMPNESYHTDPNSTTLCNDDSETAGHVNHPSHAGTEIGTETEGETENSPLLSAGEGLAAEEEMHSQRGIRRSDSVGDALKQPYVNEGEEYLAEHSGGVFGILHWYSAQYQIGTWWFILICAFSTTQMLRLNYFVSTIASQYQYIFNSREKAEALNKFFDLALPLAGAITVPFIGTLLDTCSTVSVLYLLLAISLTFGVLGFFANYALAVTGVCLFVSYRPFFYTVISDVCAKVFGFETFGTVYGLLMCICGVLNAGQGVLDKLTHTTFKMNPYPVNISLVVVTAVVGGVTVRYVKTQAEEHKRKKLTSNPSGNR
ncbi:uncharacterized protein LODBEIA_P55410 [Lodderomyces beijingensis]|uniref:Protein FMP42 n=1 Tax=Lodderomyces beijingensis TaxID=1775926 RepID=A0ABP0ZV69_9ASCO